MKTIRNTKLFNELKEASANNNDLWNVLFNEFSELKDWEIPGLFGGLDHIDEKEKGFYFHDIGCNGKDNSFVIRPQL